MTHRPQHHLSPWQVFSDVFTLVNGIFALIITALVITLAVATTETAKEKPAAEFLVNLRWDDNRDVDLDLWMQDENGQVIYYNVRETKNISLNRDSRGFTSNHLELPDGTVASSSNHEIIAIRAVMPGDYIIAVCYYSGDNREIDATVDVEKMNPTVTDVAVKHIHLNKVDDVMNVVAFHVDKDGSVQLIPTPPESANIIKEHSLTGH